MVGLLKITLYADGTSTTKNFSRHVFLNVLVPEVNGSEIMPLGWTTSLANPYKEVSTTSKEVSELHLIICLTK
ncbi:UNVERIFIED_CONTAM: hypothetical protein Slati_2539500 [Sesamum latifolium]|uniref:Uncharacterized protein n=1 Tax=Sesamum latifolium TaxID=2727402 RepID=A0AAW2WK08_9LAMI